MSELGPVLPGKRMWVGWGLEVNLTPFLPFLDPVLEPDPVFSSP